MSLGLVNATNARDLGGLPAADGRRVRPGLLFRASSLHRLTEDDVAAVAKLGLSCVVDLRSEHEVEMIGPDRLPFPPPSELVALPLSDPDNGVFASVTALLRGDVRLAEAEIPFDHDLLAAEMLRAYRWLATAGPARTAVARVLRMAVDPRMLPLLFHCTAGKDRTGWLAAVVLTALGTDRAVIVEDYLRTNELSRSTMAFILGRLAGKVPDPAIVLPMLEVRPEYLAEAFAAAERVYGDMAGYLRDGLGLDEETLTALRATLLE